MYNDEIVWHLSELCKNAFSNDQFSQYTWVLFATLNIDIQFIIIKDRPDFLLSLMYLFM